MSTDFNFQEQVPAAVSEARLSELFAGVMQRVYGWMSLGLLVTTIVAILTLGSPAILNFVFGNMIVFWGLVIGELILVISVNRAISRLSPGAGLALFFAYAALNGVTLSVIFLVYGLGTIVFAFGTTTLIFIILTVVGLTTKEDLTKWGPILFVGLLGIILASVVNFFFASTALDWAITYLGILIFMGLIVYDSNLIKKMTYATVLQGNDSQQMLNGIAVMGALRLYLDFINLFLRLLRVLGRRR
ncbi:MAG: Bax inhibitor-1/YccA family protein [Ardenticatenaceae bacterium]|nr:Bax inhibitor-1/YccA family protein [Anaerolineales bacterium]MCB8940524.1 Bax inhibitor-1/YccA family protein [Ardenticatenaceae bacterium]MCB8973545.1 Bax inhibitor-1/YccA family protein [Ardenticatenaceae bacterium]